MRIIIHIYAIWIWTHFWTIVFWLDIFKVSLFLCCMCMYTHQVFFHRNSRREHATRANRRNAFTHWYSEKYIIHAIRWTRWLDVCAYIFYYYHYYFIRFDWRECFVCADRPKNTNSRLPQSLSAAAAMTNARRCTTYTLHTHTHTYTNRCV